MRLTRFHRNRTRDRAGLLGLGVVAVLALAACGDASDDESSESTTMTIKFDGTAATYEGPDEIEPAFDIELVNNSDDVVDFAFGRHAADADVSLEEVKSWGENSMDAPPWIEDGGHFSMNVPADTTVIERGDLLQGHRYEFVVWDVTTEHAYFAALVDVATTDG